MNQPQNLGHIAYLQRRAAEQRAMILRHAHWANDAQIGSETRQFIANRKGRARELLGQAQQLLTRVHNDGFRIP